MPTALAPHELPDTAATLVAEILRTDGVRSVFQPIVDLETGAVAAYEALARGPVGPLERPDLLFDAARQAGLLGELDETCRRAAFRGAVERGLFAPLTLFVNVEPEVLDAAPLSDLLRIAGDAPGELRVVLEITERALASRPAELLRTVRRVRELGWGVALDDVGADSASLAFMALLRPDVVKLDLRLVQQRPTPEIAGIMNAVNAYAEDSGALLLAEGIEHAGHLRTALALGARLGQGWMFGRPSPTPPAAAETAVHVLRFPEPAPVSAGRLEDSPFACLPIGTPLTRSPKRLLVELSKHLEREAGRLGETCVVAAAFQHGRHFTELTAGRYRTLVEQTGFVCALGEGMSVEPVPGVRGGQLSAGDPVLGEWDVVVLSPHYSAALIARDLGDSGPEMDRMFEYALTYQRDTAVRAARGLLARVVSPLARHAEGATDPRASDGRGGPDGGGLRSATPVVPGSVGDALVRQALAAATSGVTIADMTREDHPLVYVNPAFEALAGLPAAELLGRNCRFLQGGQADPAVLQRIRVALQAGQESKETLLNFREPGATPWWNEVHMSPVADRSGRVVAYIGVQNDVTARVEAERALARESELVRGYLATIEQLAYTDSLTGLLNRRRFEDLVSGALVGGDRDGSAVALLFVDLDGFKDVNDSRGHAAGDELLQVVARRIEAAIGSGLLARLGGDEFLVALTDLAPATARADAQAVADAIARSLAEPIPLAGSEVLVGASAGFSLYPEDAGDFGALLHLADLQMYETKRARQARGGQVR